MTRPFLKLFCKVFEHKVPRTFENFEGKTRKTEENASHHGLAWIGMDWHYKSICIHFYDIEMQKISECPFYGAFQLLTSNFIVSICK